MLLSTKRPRITRVSSPFKPSGRAMNIRRDELELTHIVGRGKSSAVVGALISSVRDSCRAGMLDWSPRIKLAMYTCDIQASSQSASSLRQCISWCAIADGVADVLGKVYGVVARRRGRIVSEEMKEGTSFFTIRSMMPVVESFGFADGTSHFLRSPLSLPLYLLSHADTLDRDPKTYIRSGIPSTHFLGLRDSPDGSFLGPHHY